MTSTYIRVRIEGTLTTLTPLHIGDGGTIDDAQAASRQTDNPQIQDAAKGICINANGAPYLPSTTLRGALRSLVPDASLRNRLFGSATGDDRSENAPAAGKLRIYDAHATFDQAAPHACASSLRTRIAIDPRLGAVKPHLLASKHFVAPGTEFRVLIEADYLSSTELALVLHLLSRFEATGHGIGSSRRNDCGQLQWTKGAKGIQVIDKDSLTDWLASGKSSALPWKSIECDSEAHDVASQAIAECDRPERTVRIAIAFETPWLIKEERQQAAESASTERMPDHEYARDHQGKPLVPATALKGWLRHRARKIVLTRLAAAGVALPRAEHLAEEAASEIFGSTDKAGCLAIGALRGEKQAEPHLQHFAAIDRFTGSVAKGDRTAQERTGGKLYSVSAAQPCRVEGVATWLARADAKDWRLGLLALVFRDASEGDLALGWGKARGFGSGRLEFSPVAPADSVDGWFDWAALRAKHEYILKEAVASFDQKIAKLAQTNFAEAAQ